MSTPTIGSISPASGTTSGGTSVIITGSNLSDVTSVLFGETKVAVSPSTDTQVICATPFTLTAGEVSVLGMNSSTTWSNNTTSDISGVSFQSVSVSPTTGQYQIACVYNGGLYTSNDYGTTWALNQGTGLPTDSTNNYGYGKWQSVAISDCSTNTYLIAVTVGSGKIYVSNNSGGDWSTPVSTNLNYFSVSMTADGKIQSAAVYGSQYMYVSTTYGITFEAKSISTYNWINIAINSGSGYYQTIVAKGSIMYRSDTSGNNWKSVAFSYPWTWNAMDSTGKYQTATTTA